MKSFKDFIEEALIGPTRMRLQNRVWQLRSIMDLGQAKREVEKEFDVELKMDSAGRVLDFIWLVKEK